MTNKHEFPARVSVDGRLGTCTQFRDTKVRMTKVKRIGKSDNFETWYDKKIGAEYYVVFDDDELQTVIGFDPSIVQFITVED